MAQTVKDLRSFNLIPNTNIIHILQLLSTTGSSFAQESEAHVSGASHILDQVPGVDGASICQVRMSFNIKSDRTFTFISCINSTKFWRKLIYVKSLEELGLHVVVEKAAIPEKVKQYDAKRH